MYNISWKGKPRKRKGKPSVRQSIIAIRIQDRRLFHAATPLNYLFTHDPIDLLCTYQFLTITSHKHKFPSLQTKPTSHSKHFNVMFCMPNVCILYLHSSPLLLLATTAVVIAISKTSTHSTTTTMTPTETATIDIDVLR